MMDRLALRDRLAASFALALVIAYVAIALCALLVVHRAVEGSIDGRLSTVAQAIVAIAGDERDEVDRKDRAQFASMTADASGAFVLDRAGAVVLGTTSEVPAWVASAVGAEAVGQIFTRRDNGRDVRALIEKRRKKSTENTIVVWQSLQIVDDVQRAVLLVLGAFGIAVAIAGYAIGAQIARRGLVPLTQMSAVIADIAAHDLDARVGPQPHADELGTLATTFDGMLERLQAAFERQRRFTADASHDLRAPLATLRAEVDLALRRERTAGEYRAALNAIARDADQLDRLIDALLAAARTEAGELDLQPLDLSAIVAASVEELTPFAQAKHVRIEVAGSSNAEIRGDANLLERAILAALHNAVKFTPDQSAINIDVVSGERVELRIRDEGSGFTEAALVHGFERFWRDDAARGREAGSGLGLAIAGEIVRRCGGLIQLRNAPEGGAEVCMSFPALAPDRDRARTFELS